MWFRLNPFRQTNHLRSSSSAVINITCGPDGPTFVVHLEKVLLSPYLCDLLPKTYDNDTVLEIGLGKDQAYLLEGYIHFLYTGTLATTAAEPSDTPAAIRAELELELLGMLHRFATVTRHGKFRNATVDGIIEISRVKDKESGVHHLPDPAKFHHFPWHAPVKRCLVYLYAHFMDPEDPVLDRPENQQFMREVLKACVRRFKVESEQGDLRGCVLKKCDYHEHEEGVRCDESEED